MSIIPSFFRSVQESIRSKTTYTTPVFLPKVRSFENVGELLSRHDAVGTYARMNPHVSISQLYDMVFAMDGAHFYEFCRALRKGRRLYAIAGGKQDE